ncbi:SAC3/GANP/Nin1/mts3/eIF-3 p25 family-domain-containing protein [Vararia minispora EC-137]|uniref:SAC3/GANP/Nin1/mts3/eIF-3 p25 family-domain-containing protein n=1 Tax=Vararia minispora EC-137 TaxID=1314806 RepID=A0ACB8QPW0_9AGAM|nr:SAC3/GANP/Nin1/mts3/eIF-3 p25 family-domain-containing protein [Vararia minispora EC-137]
MSSESWPPQLKEWVATCLGQMTDANRVEAQAELRQVINEAFNAKTLWTTDWKGVQLQSLLPKPLPTPVGNKRKSNDGQHTSSKKAKKSQITKSVSANALDPSDQLAMQRRAQRFQREHNIELQKSRLSKSGPLHARVFDAFRSHSPFSGNPDDPEADPNVPNWDKFTIVGTSREIFKDYLRLTSEPQPHLIRPLPVLQQTLQLLKHKWREPRDVVPYNWICSQFKSLRQDLTVQRIKTELTVQVYEIHARMALEVSDMVEYNACQGMLRQLYDMGIKGKNDEFTAYRILMLLHGRNSSELNLYVGQLTPEQKGSKPVRHALAVQRALAIGNYHALFELYLNAENMGAYIMDHFVERERIRALLCISRSYQKLPLTVIMQELAWDSTREVYEFLVKHGAACFANPNALDDDKELACKQAAPALQKAFEEKFRRVQIKGAV